MPRKSLLTSTVLDTPNPNAKENNDCRSHQMVVMFEMPFFFQSGGSAYDRRINDVSNIKRVASIHSCIYNEQTLLSKFKHSSQHHNSYSCEFSESGQTLRNLLFFDVYHTGDHVGWLIPVYGLQTFIQQSYTTLNLTKQTSCFGSNCQINFQ